MPGSIMDPWAEQEEDISTMEAKISGPIIDPRAEKDRIITYRETKKRRLELFQAAVNGNWKVANDIFKKHPEDLEAEISERGYTALHIAVEAKQINFVKEFLKEFKKIDLTLLLDAWGRTALFHAVASGEVELATAILKENKELAMVRDDFFRLPIHMAASLGDRCMVKYLYEEIAGSLNGKDCIEFFITVIDTKMYDFAFELLDDYPELAFARNGHLGETALHALAKMQLEPSNSKMGFCFDVENKEKQIALQLVERLWKAVALRSDSELFELITVPTSPIFDAAKQGNIQFLRILIREYPNVIWAVSPELNYNLFHFAVMNRQEDIFMLIYEIGLNKNLIVSGTNKEVNNILHLAGKLAPKDRLNILSNAALQLQRELLWFQEVKKVVEPRYAKAKNINGFTPKELFEKEHEQLREKGEKWLKETAEACMVVATLIATVAFAAAITGPGGNKEDTGFPFFLDKASFQIFAISDAFSLALSSISMVAFLSIFTTRHAQEDFLLSSPRKLKIGLVTLFMSIATMMVMFSATFFILFRDGMLWITIIVTIISSLPVFFFISQHFQLFYEAVAPASLFKRGKSNLFRKEEEVVEQVPLFCNALHVITAPASLFKRCKSNLFRKEKEVVELHQEAKQLNARLECRCSCTSIV